MLMTTSSTCRERDDGRRRGGGTDESDAPLDPGPCSRSCSLVREERDPCAVSEEAGMGIDRELVF